LPFATTFTILIMSDKKHIDRLFQEGFKDFEATPDDAVWKNIESKLTENKKKPRVINQVVDIENSNSDQINTPNTNVNTPLENKDVEIDTNASQGIADHNPQEHLGTSPKTKTEIITHPLHTSQQTARANHGASEYAHRCSYIRRKKQLE